MKKLFEYNPNNSGGSWWLSDEDWKNLEKNGWKVVWANQEFIYKNGNFVYDKNGYPKTRPKTENDYGYSEDGRWLGTLARYAFKHFDSVRECLQEFEKITGQDVSEEGCNCCGAPHLFSWDSGYCSGADCLQYLYDILPSSLRNACDLLNQNRGTK